MWALNPICFPSCSAALNSEELLEVVGKQPCHVVASPTPFSLAHQDNTPQDAYNHRRITSPPHGFCHFPYLCQSGDRAPASLSFEPRSYTLQEPTKEMEEEPHNPVPSSLQARGEGVPADLSAGSAFSICVPTRSLEPWTKASPGLQPHKVRSPS